MIGTGCTFSPINKIDQLLYKVGSNRHSLKVTLSCLRSSLIILSHLSLALFQQRLYLGTSKPRLPAQNKQIYIWTDNHNSLFPTQINCLSDQVPELLTWLMRDIFPTSY